MKISGKAKVLGVIGHPVGHSRSPAMHNSAIEALGLDYVYVPFDIAPENLAQAVAGIRALGIAGFNVTIPHKEAIIPLLDEVEEKAARIRSVNTVTNVDGKLIGSSTDGPGFMRSLVEAGYSPSGGSALVVGAGGSAKAVAFALADAGTKVTVTGRSPEKAAALAASIEELTGCKLEWSGLDGLAECSMRADLLVNCTPMGMHPNTDSSPVAADYLRRDLLVYDLVYNPLETRLLTEAKSVGARTINGVKMLVYQGALSFEKWTGIEPPVNVMENAVMELVNDFIKEKVS